MKRNEGGEGHGEKEGGWRRKEGVRRKEVEKEGGWRRKEGMRMKEEGEGTKMEKEGGDEKEGRWRRKEGMRRKEDGEGRRE